MKYGIILLGFLVLCCQNSPRLYQFAGQAMTMHYRILVGHPLSLTEQEHIKTIIQAIFEEVDQTYNKWNPSSEISKLNQLPAYVYAPLSAPLCQFLQQVEKIVQVSGGKFDPTIEPLQELWKTHLAEGKIPSLEAIRTAQESIGWDKLHFDNTCFWKKHDNTRLDLGGMAKGLAIDLLVEKLNRLGYANVYVEWGGEIRASGKHPENRAWCIYIRHPDTQKLAQAFATVELTNQAIATSGDYLQKWTITQGQEKITYFHLIDPFAGIPLISQPHTIVSASVRASSCAYADGLATAAMFFSTLEAAKKWAQELERQDAQLRFWLLAADGSFYMTSKESLPVLQQ